MMRLYSGCGTRRLTSTTMVFFILVETTWPTFSAFNPCFSSAIASSMLVRPRHSLLGRFQLPFAQQGVNAGAIFPHRAGLLQPVQLPHRLLKMEPEKLLIHFP